MGKTLKSILFQVPLPLTSLYLKSESTQYNIFKRIKMFLQYSHYGKVWEEKRSKKGEGGKTKQQRSSSLMKRKIIKCNTMKATWFGPLLT